MHLLNNIHYFCAKLLIPLCIQWPIHLCYPFLDETKVKRLVSSLCFLKSQVNKLFLNIKVYLEHGKSHSNELSDSM